MATVRKEFVFSPEDAERAEALALANYPRPGGRGNVNELVRRLINAASPNQSALAWQRQGRAWRICRPLKPKSWPRRAGRPPLDVSTLQGNRAGIWQSPPSDAGLPETVKELTRG